jgi:hypothetical protein
VRTNGERIVIEAFEAALAAIDEKGRQHFGDGWYQRVRDRQNSLEEQYVNLHVEGRDPIDYSELPTQAAYIYSYALTRAAYVEEFLSRHRTSHGKPLFSRKAITVLSFGGGPASELVGLVQYLMANKGEPVTRVNYYVGDKDEEWKKCAKLVANNIDTHIEIDVNYRRLDVMDAEVMSEIDLSGTDLVILSYLMSELSKLNGREVIIENFRGALKGIYLIQRYSFSTTSIRCSSSFSTRANWWKVCASGTTMASPLILSFPTFPKHSENSGRNSQKNQELNLMLCRSL